MWPVVDNSLKVLTKGLDGAALRHKILANNIANVDTPNFKRQDVSFYTQLKQSMDDGDSGSSLNMIRTNEKHMVGRTNVHTSGPQIVQTDGQVREDGNNVNVDVEMAKIAENGAYYNTLATAVARKYKLIESAIRGGGQ